MAVAMLDPLKFKQDFPILNRHINGHPLVYLDNAATSQKPQAVIDAIVDYYQNHNANVHRGVHTLSDESTSAYEAARATVASFIGAAHPEELVFVRNTTEAINLVAHSWGEANLKEGDEILVTELEHHSDLIPWQRLAQKTGAKLVHMPLDENGDLALNFLESLVGKQTKLIALTQVSNVLGTVVDIYHFIKTIRKAGSKAKVLVDGAQSVPHLPINVADLNVDFFCFSGHKMLGPMGIGCLYAKKELLENMEPFLVGGGMIDTVTKTTATWAPLPDKFEAGTPNVAGAVGLATACTYLKNIGMENIHAHEQMLTEYGLKKCIELEKKGQLTLYGQHDAKKRAGILTFNVTGIHAHDVAQILDREAGIAIRSGHHCNQVLLDQLSAPATCRASVYLYNTTADIDALMTGIQKARQVFKLK